MMTIEILVGMIASGKSTYATKRAQMGWLIINDDDIVTSLHGGDYTLYEEQLKAFYKSIENHIINTAILHGRDIVIDRGLNISANARKRFIGIANAADIAVNAVVFPRKSPNEHALRRFHKNHRNKSLQHWRKVAKRHNDLWDEPNITEGFRNIKVI